jgi:hypothetical protein
MFRFNIFEPEPPEPCFSFIEREKLYKPTKVDGYRELTT